MGFYDRKVEGIIKNLSKARTPPFWGTSKQQHHRLDAVTRKWEGRCSKLRTATLNIGTPTGKGREVAADMVARKIDILCLQELRWNRVGAIWRESQDSWWWMQVILLRSRRLEMVSVSFSVSIGKIKLEEEVRQVYIHETGNTCTWYEH